MEPGKKSAVKKAMRVATTFTGAAAFAAGFAPAANAATHPVMQGRYHKLPIAEKQGLGVTPQTTIHSGPCSVHPTWLHFEWALEDNLNTRYLTCMGFAGTDRFTQAVSMFSQCGGNNYGYFDSGSPYLSFRPGTTYRTFPHRYNLWLVHISRWTGSDTCPL
jgi:hypothetical protein